MAHAAGLFCAALAFGSAAQAQDLTDGLGGAFTLTDQNGGLRTQMAPGGEHQLVFFGYANCQEICSAALPLMADTVDAVADLGGDLVPVMITVDPIRDTPEAMGPILRELHPDFVGLTGPEADLAAVYEAYEVEFEDLFVDPFYGTVFAHGSFIYLLDPNGAVLTLLPPVLGPEQMAGIVMGYLARPGDGA